MPPSPFVFLPTKYAGNKAERDRRRGFGQRSRMSRRLRNTGKTPRERLALFFLSFLFFLAARSTATRVAGARAGPLQTSSHPCIHLTARDGTSGRKRPKRKRPFLPLRPLFSGRSMVHVAELLSVETGACDPPLFAKFLIFGSIREGCNNEPELEPSESSKIQSSIGVCFREQNISHPALKRGRCVDI